MVDVIEQSKVLITGGAGFIGSNLADKLVSNNEIVIVDDLSMGNLDNVPDSPNVHFFKHSITDTKFMKELLLDWDFDYIFLFAAVASVADTIVRPLETHEINQNANIHILETIRLNKLNVKKVLFASSAAVYGNNPELPKKETSMVDPLSPYAIDKYATERFTIDYGNLYGIPTVCTRFFNVYGPKQNPASPYSGVLSLIVNCIKDSRVFHVFGDGEQTRDFVYIDDVVFALILLMVNADGLHDVFNVATGDSISLNDTITVLEELIGKRLEVVYDDARKGDIKQSRADVTKLNKLGFKAQNDIRQGLKKYLEAQNIL